MKPLELAGVLVSAGVVEVIGLGQMGRPSGLRMIIAGMAGHLGKLAVKVLSLAVTGALLNRTGLPVIQTAALYAVFGILGGLIAWGGLSAWLRLRGHREGN